MFDVCVCFVLYGLFKKIFFGAWVHFVDLTRERVYIIIYMIRILKCACAYDGLCSSWGDPVRLTGTEIFGSSFVSV